MTIRFTTQVHHLGKVQFVFFFSSLFVSHSSTCHSYLRQVLCSEIKTSGAPPFREHPASKIIMHASEKMLRWIILLWQLTQQSWTIIHSSLLRKQHACTRGRNKCMQILLTRKSLSKDAQIQTADTVSLLVENRLYHPLVPARRVFISSKRKLTMRGQEIFNLLFSIPSNIWFLSTCIEHEQRKPLVTYPPLKVNGTKPQPSSVRWVNRNNILHRSKPTKWF